MANISTDFSVWSTTASSNQPDSSDTNTIQADLQAIQAAVKGAFPNVGGAVNATHTELNYVDGVTSAIQTQLDAKVSAGANSSITSLSGLTTPLSVAQGGTGATTNAGTAYALKGANSDITSLAGLTTPLTVAQGGIGAATLTANYALLGNGTSAPQMIAPGTSGNVLTSDGTTWASTAPAVSGGMTLLGTLTTTSGTTHTLPDLVLTDYKLLYFTVNGVSFNASAQLTINSNAISESVGTGGTGRLYGDGNIDLTTGICTTNIGSIGGALTSVISTPYVAASGMTTASTSITFAGGTFDLGSIKIYGVK